jgi:hypothetical protein
VRSEKCGVWLVLLGVQCLDEAAYFNFRAFEVFQGASFVAVEAAGFAVEFVVGLDDVALGA